MISSYVLQELEKLFPDCYVTFKYSRGSFEISIKKSTHYWTYSDREILNYDSEKRKISVFQPIDTDTLLTAISLLSLVKNVKLEEVSKDED